MPTTIRLVDPLPDPLALLGRHPANPSFADLLLDDWNAHHIVLERRVIRLPKDMGITYHIVLT